MKASQIHAGAGFNFHWINFTITNNKKANIFLNSGGRGQKKKSGAGRIEFTESPNMETMAFHNNLLRL